MHQFVSRFIRYGFTGGIAAIADLLLFILLLKIDFPLIIAAGVSFFLAAVLNYRLTSRYVFNERPGFSLFARFLGAALLGLSVNVGVTALAAEQFNFPTTSAKLLGIAVAFSLNFMLNQLFVFTPRQGR